MTVYLSQTQLRLLWESTFFKIQCTPST